MSSKSIGIFDSGFGGITILREIVKKLPQYNYIYLGDSSRAPYGSCSQNTIYQFCKQAVDFLFKKNCQLIIFACNTASAKALRKIQQEYLFKNPKYQKDKTKRILGVIIPTSEIAAKTTKNNKIGVMATKSTVLSRAFNKEIKKINNKIQVLEIACPLLVPIIEAGEHDRRIINIILEKYLKSLVNSNIDTLILGCTHYSVLEAKVRNILPSNIQILSEPKIVAQKLKEYLDIHKEIESQLTKNANIKFFTTDLTKGPRQNNSYTCITSSCHLYLKNPSKYLDTLQNFSNKPDINLCAKCKSYFVADPDKFKKLGSEFFGKEIDIEVIRLF